MPDDLPPQTDSERGAHWRDQEGDDQPVLPEADRAARLGCLVLVGGALVALAGGVVFWLRMQPAGAVSVLSAIVWQHKEPLYPIHVVALDDSEAIMQHFLAAEQRGHSKQSQARDNLKSALENLAKERKGPVI